jgi:hypothetical protein
LPWDSAHFVDLRLHLKNDGKYDMRDMDLSLASDLRVIAAATDHY